MWHGLGSLFRVGKSFHGHGLRPDGLCLRLLNIRFALGDWQLSLRALGLLLFVLLNLFVRQHELLRVAIERLGDL